MDLWAALAADALWRNALAAVPLALLVAAVCRWLPCRPATRHVLWLGVLLWLIVPPVLPSPQLTESLVPRPPAPGTSVPASEAIAPAPQAIDSMSELVESASKLIVAARRFVLITFPPLVLRIHGSVQRDYGFVCLGLICEALFELGDQVGQGSGVLAVMWAAMLVGMARDGGIAPVPSV